MKKDAHKAFSMGLPEGYRLEQRGRVALLAKEDVYDLLTGLGIFETGDPEGWKGARGALRGGRGGAVRITLEGGRSMVVKELLRGGVVGVFNPRFHGSPRRLLQEAALSNHLLEEGVPAAAVLMGRAKRSGAGFWRLHLGTEEAAGARSLLELVRDGARVSVPLVEDAFFHAGGAVRKLHDAGVFHQDLNFGNLLAARHSGDGPWRVWIIDLDRSRPGPVLERPGRVANLARLFRHAVKHGLRDIPLFPLYWRRFLHGYAGGSVDEADLQDAVERRFRRSLILHRLSWWIQGR